MKVPMLAIEAHSPLPEDVKGKMSQTANDGWVSFSQKQWEELKMDLVFAVIGSWEVPKLIIGGLNDPMLIGHIANVQMRSLKQIKLNKNQIESLDGLQNLFMPALESFEVGANHLTSLRVFRKTNTPSLSVIIMGNNSIKDLSVLSQIQCPKLQRIFLTSYQSGEQCSDARPAAKFAAKNIVGLSLWSSNRIRQDKFKQTIMRKYSNLHMDF